MSTSIKKEWPKELTQSVYRHFDTSFAADERPNQRSLRDFSKVRVYGTQFRENTHTEWECIFTIDVLSITQIDNNAYTAVNQAGLIGEKFPGCLVVQFTGGYIGYFRPVEELKLQKEGKRAEGIDIFDYSISNIYRGHIKWQT